MNTQVLWFAARGAGVVSLIFLTGVVYLGILSVLRWRTPAWPPFATAGFHENLALFSVSFLGIHITAAALDPFLSLGPIASLVPFATSYKPIPMALGIISLYLVIALILTSIFRKRIGTRLWRLVHWTAYAAWPVAVLHTIGTGTDATAPWMIGILLACCMVVATATIVRFTTGRPAAAPARPRVTPGRPHAAPARPTDAPANPTRSSAAPPPTRPSPNQAPGRPDAILLPGPAPRP